jgi:hypothetical protein
VTNPIKKYTDAPIQRQAKQNKQLTPPTYQLAFSKNMSPSMNIGGMFWKQLNHNPDDGVRNGPRNVGEF